MEFAFLDYDGGGECRDIAAKIEALGNPELLFPQEIFDDVRSPLALHNVMRRLGYVAIQPLPGQRWRWYKNGSEFAARWAYVSEKLASNPGEIPAFLDSRGAARVSPRVGPREASHGPRKGRVGPRKAKTAAARSGRGP